MTVGIDLRRGVRGRFVRVGDLERLPGRAEDPGTRVGAAAGADADHGGKIGGLVVRRRGGEPAGDDRAERRMTDAGDRQVAGVEEIGGPRVAPLLAGHRTDHRQPIGDLRRLRPVFGETHPGDLGGDRLRAPAVGMVLEGAEGLELRRAPLHPEEDAGLVAAPQFLGVEGGDGAPAGAGEDEARRGQAGGAQQVATRGHRDHPRRKGIPIIHPRRASRPRGEGRGSLNAGRGTRPSSPEPRTRPRTPRPDRPVRRRDRGRCGVHPRSARGPAHAGRAPW